MIILLSGSKIAHCVFIMIIRLIDVIHVTSLQHAVVVVAYVIVNNIMDMYFVILVILLLKKILNQFVLMRILNISLFFLISQYNNYTVDV